MSQPIRLLEDEPLINALCTWVCWMATIVIFLMFIISAIMLLFLPEQLPIIHEGAKTYNVPSILGVWLFPVLALVINLSFIKQKRLSPINSIAFGIIAIIMTVFYINAL